MKSRAESHTFLDWLKTQVEYGQGQSLRWESMQLVLAQDSHPAKLAGSPCWCNWDTPRSAPRGRSDTSPGVTSQPAPCQACLGLLSGLLQAEQGAAVPQLCQSILQLLRRSEQKVLLSLASTTPPLLLPRTHAGKASPEVHPGLGTAPRHGTAPEPGSARTRLPAPRLPAAHRPSSPRIRAPPPPPPPPPPVGELGPADCLRHPRQFWQRLSASEMKEQSESSSKRSESSKEKRSPSSHSANMSSMGPAPPGAGSPPAEPGPGPPAGD